MTDIAHWPVERGHHDKALPAGDLETKVAYLVFALAFAVAIAFPLGII